RLLCSLTSSSQAPCSPARHRSTRLASMSNRCVASARTAPPQLEAALIAFELNEIFEFSEIAATAAAATPYKRIKDNRSSLTEPRPCGSGYIHDLPLLWTSRRQGNRLPGKQ